MVAVFKREIKSQFISMTGFLFAALLLLFVGIFATQFHLLGGYASFEHTLQSTCTILLLGVPLLTMRSLPEDKRAKTDRLLYSLPLKLSQIILGKYLAMLVVFAIPTLILATYPLVLSAFGKVNLGSAYACVLAFFLLGAALIAIGTFVSALTENQLSAAVVTIGVIAVMVLLNVFNMLTDAAGQPIIGSYAIRFVIDWVSVLSRYTNFSAGIFDYAALLYYASLAFVFLFLTVRVYEKRRWG